MNGLTNKGIRLIAVAALAFGLAGLTTGLGGSNVLDPDYTEDFERAEGLAITNVLGWSSSDLDESVIATNDFEFVALPRPIMPPVTPNSVLNLDTQGGVLTNAFDMADGEFPVLYLDTMINMVAHEDDWPNITDNETKLALFLDVASNLVVYHGGATGEEQVYTVLTNKVNGTPVPTEPGEWHRLTVEMDMVTASYFDIIEEEDVYFPFFRVFLNGNELSHDAEGFAEPTANEDPNEYAGGAWFRFANIDALTEGQYRKVGP